MGRSPSLSASGERQSLHSFHIKVTTGEREHGWYLLHACYVIHDESTSKNSSTLVALWVKLSFSYIQQVCSSLLHYSNVISNFNKFSYTHICVKHEQAWKRNEAQEFWVTPAVMRSPLTWLWKESVNIYRAWSSHDVDQCCWIPHVFSVSLNTHACFSAVVMWYSWYVD